MMSNSKSNSVQRWNWEKIQLKIGHKKQLESIRVNPPNPWPESWDEDNLIESRWKINYKI